MGLGGGTFTVQNKVLPGAYINFVSAANASASLSNRGVAAIGFAVGWGESGKILEITAEDLQKDSMNIFGCAYTDDKLRDLREVFLNATTVLAYRLDDAEGARASCALGTAKCAGTKGNELRISVKVSGEDPEKFEVSTLMGAVVTDVQTVGSAEELVDNDLVEFVKSGTLTAGSMPFSGGTDGGVGEDSHQKFLDKLENYSFNALGCVSDNDAVKRLYVSFCKRMRDDVGKKFQCVVHDFAADYEGVINVKNTVSDSENKAALVAWATGVAAGTAVNKSALNKRYDGEYSPNTDYKQSELEKAILAGEFTLHRVGSEVRVLQDINSLVTVSDTKGELFKDNQTIRVIDQIGNDIAVLFSTKYLGNVPNDKAGRISLWSDIVKHHKQLMDIRAIEDFSEDDVSVEQGDSKKSVVVTDYVTVVNAMAKLYMTVTIN